MEEYLNLVSINYFGIIQGPEGGGRGDCTGASFILGQGEKNKNPSIGPTQAIWLFIYFKIATSKTTKNAPLASFCFASQVEIWKDTKITHKDLLLIKIKNWLELIHVFICIESQTIV